MKSIIEFIVQLGGVALIFVVVWAFVHFTGYSEFYDKMMYDDDEDTDLTLKKNNKDNDDESIHHVSI